MYLKPTELKIYSNTTNEGTKENPIVKPLPWNYKLPLYLGYTIKWNYDWITRTEYNPQYRNWNEWSIEPVFKKSYTSLDPRRDSNNWDFLMEILLPEMSKDNLINDTVKNHILSFDKKSLIITTMEIINQHVENIDYPFVNIKEDSRIQIFN